ncbi:hypothetical protein OS493_028502 [Desmophyllum pertusum]|uniref:HECT domain-containing protein n=1 Tax=Desmophyllum pertusum TaxID=174260 RepID=A0A9X0CXY0_9CNID|nr:hypothetical protein OS493_028502 [Desmophyllum pertusum]
MDVFTDQEDCSDSSDTDDRPPILSCEQVENTITGQNQEQTGREETNRSAGQNQGQTGREETNRSAGQNQGQTGREETNRTIRSWFPEVTTPISSYSRPVPVVDSQTVQGSDNTRTSNVNFEGYISIKSDTDICQVIRHAQGNLDVAIESLLGQSEQVLDREGASGFDEECLSLGSVKSPALALTQYREQMITGGLRHFININRNSDTLFRDIVGIYKRADQDLRRRPDVTFEGEEGVDAGGPTLEFLWLALSQMKNGDGREISLFEGASHGHLLPIHRTSYLNSGLFYVFGKVVAHSILHGGAGFPGLSPAMARFIADGEPDSASSLVSVDDIPDLKYKDIIEKMLEAKETDDIQQLCFNSLVPVLLDNAGFTGVMLSLENKDIAVHQIMVHEVLLKRKLEVEDIRRGLESLSLITFLSSSPSLCKRVFPSAAEFIIKPEMITSQITLMEEESLNSTNRRNAFNWLHQYINELGERSKMTATTTCDQTIVANTSEPNSIEEITLQSFHDDLPGLADFCQFISGAPIPPQQMIRVRFSDSQKLPVAETCFLWLVLPATHTSFTAFQQNMDIALKFESTGFYIM